MRETRVKSLGQEGLLEKGMATHSSILAPPQKKGLKEIWVPKLVQIWGIGQRKFKLGFTFPQQVGLRAELPAQLDRGFALKYGSINGQSWQSI